MPVSSTRATLLPVRCPRAGNYVGPDDLSYGTAREPWYDAVMTGRILFALVWAIIAAGVALPLFPRDLATSAVAVTTDPVQLAVGADAFGCEDCPVDDTGRTACPSDCPCGPAQPALFVCRWSSRSA